MKVGERYLYTHCDNKDIVILEISPTPPYRDDPTAVSVKIILNILGTRWPAGMSNNYWTSSAGTWKLLSNQDKVNE